MQPFFFTGAAGQLFGTYFPPCNTREARGQILFFPPFAEELNRSRHMISRQARSFARAGFGVLLVDPFGTGDSEGIYAEATWDIWLRDMKAAGDWLRTEKGRPVTFWCLRSGALLAADLLRRHPDLSHRLLLWAPVSQGKNFVTQFLRIKMAADMAGPENTSLTTKQMMTELDRGQPLEIAGYGLPPALALPMRELSLAALPLPPETVIDWLDVTLSESAPPPPAAARTIQGWRDRGHRAAAHAVHDPQFWTLQEPEWAHRLIAKTTMLLTEGET